MKSLSQAIYIYIILIILISILKLVLLFIISGSCVFIDANPTHVSHMYYIFKFHERVFFSIMFSVENLLMTFARFHLMSHVSLLDDFFFSYHSAY